MGIISNWKKKNEEKYCYIVDITTLKEYLQQEIEFSIENQIETGANLNIYINQEKHHIQTWNDEAQNALKTGNGITIYYDEHKYKSIEELITTHLSHIKGYFKIQLLDNDNVFLNEYKKNHPELKLENDYNE